DRNHVVVERSAQARLELRHLDAEALGSPPRLEAVLRRPEIPEVVHGTVIRAFEADRLAAAGCCALVVHLFFYLEWVARAARRLCSASPKRSSRFSQRFR